MSVDEGGSKPKWQLHTTRTSDCYRCGLKPGDRITLIGDLDIIDSEGNRVDIIAADLVWLVIDGSPSDPGIVWLVDPTGSRHTWDDDPAIFDSFRRVITDDEGQKT